MGAREDREEADHNGTHVPAQVPAFEAC